MGDKGKTEKLSLRGWFDYQVGENSLSNLTIVTDDDLGKVLVVVVGCDTGWFEDHWYVSFVTVVNLQLQEVDEFPCYHWIDGDSHVTITATTSKFIVVFTKSLSRKIVNITAFVVATKRDVAGNNILLQQRARQLVQRRDVYRWSKDEISGLPSGIDDTVAKLPADEQFRTVKSINFTTDAVKSMGSLKIAGLFVDCDDLHGYEVLARNLGGERQLYEAGRWTSDVEFGRQMMNGVNPIFIEKCRAVPPNFQVTNEMVQPFMSLSLEEEMKVCEFKLSDQ